MTFVGANWLKKSMAIIAVWAVLGVIYASPIYFEVRAEGMGHAAWRIFSWGILTWLAWAPLTPVMVWLARHFSLIGGAWKTSLLVHLPAFLLVSAAHSAADGFDVLGRVGPEHIQALIFVTAFDQYALKAFDVHALDYLLKPFDDERFAHALKRAKAQIEAHEINRLSKRLVALLEERESERKVDRKKYLTRLMIKDSGRVVLVKVNDVDFIEADGNYAKLHVGRKAHLLREKMNDLEGRLDPAKFVRIHRSIIVNLDRIKEMHPYFNGDHVVVLEDGRQLRMSRTRREHLEARLKISHR